MKEIRHLFWHEKESALCDEFYKADDYFIVNESNCKGCIVHHFRRQEIKYDLPSEFSSNNIKRHFKRILMEEYKESFEDLLK